MSDHCCVLVALMRLGNTRAEGLDGGRRRNWRAVGRECTRCGRWHRETMCQRCLEERQDGAKVHLMGSVGWWAP